MTLSIDRPEAASQPNIARPYTLTGGRTRTAIALPFEAIVEAIVPVSQTDWSPGDIRSKILELCATRPSVAEISAHLNLPIGVARVLVGDLVESAKLRVHASLGDDATVSERRSLIERTLSGLRAL